MPTPRKIITCKVCQRERPHVAFGLCSACYERQKIEKLVICSECGEERKHEGKGLCPKCYLKYYRHKKGMCKPMSENKSCSQYLGIVVAEQLLSKIFKDVEKMPNNHKGFDFICNKGMKIDVKSSTLHFDKRHLTSKPRWSFTIKKNKIPDYFLCLGFDNMESLNPMYIWLVPSNEINDKMKVSISTSTISKWQQYSQPIDKVISCCNKMKQQH